MFEPFMKFFRYLEHMEEGFSLKDYVNLEPLLNFYQKAIEFEQGISGASLLEPLE